MKLTLFLVAAVLCAGNRLVAQETSSNNAPREGERFHEENRGLEPQSRGPEGGRERGFERGRASNEPVGFFHALYPPELVLRNADKIGLKADQIQAITNALPKNLAEAQNPLRTEAKKLEQLLKCNPVDEAQALAQLNKLLSVENAFKRDQLQALIKIKNVLTSDQRAKLDELAQPQPQRRGAGDLRNEGELKGHEEPQFGPREGGSHSGEEPHFGPREGGEASPNNH